MSMLPIKSQAGAPGTPIMEGNQAPPPGKQNRAQRVAQLMYRPQTPEQRSPGTGGPMGPQGGPPQAMPPGGPQPMPQMPPAGPKGKGGRGQRPPMGPRVPGQPPMQRPNMPPQVAPEGPGFLPPGALVQGQVAPAWFSGGR